MNLKENKTKVLHKVFGEGIYLGHLLGRNDVYSIKFETCGVKHFIESAFKDKTLKIIDDNAILNDALQFDASDLIIGNKNILEAFKNKRNVFFNESYTIVGDCLSVFDLYASYDLTIIGDLNASKIEIRKKLIVIGDIKADSIYVADSLICTGDITADNIEVGGDIQAKNILCNEKFYCQGNVIVNNDVDLGETKVDKVLVAGSGMMGQGTIEADSIIALEYFNYDGNVIGNMFDLYSEKKVLYQQPIMNNNIPKELSNTELIEKIGSSLLTNIKEQGSIDEETLLQYLTDIEKEPLFNVAEWKKVFNQIVRLSYEKDIVNLRDYILITYAKYKLPEELMSYETVEHVFGKMYEEVIPFVNDMDFYAGNIEEFLLCLYVVVNYSDELSFDKEMMLDKIFQSVGIKYNTVKSFFAHE